MSDGASAIEPGAADREAAGSTWVILGSIVCLAVVLRIGTAISTGLTDPAGLMTLRFSQNIAAGNGFVYNVGERVLGTTTPLFALMVAAGIKLGLPCIGLAKALGILSDAGLCLVAAAWMRASGLPKAAPVAAFLVAVDPHLGHWAISATETSLVTLGIASALLAFTMRREVLAYAVLGLLFLLRWDTVVLTAVITAAIIHRDRKLPIRGLGVFVATIAPWVIFATWYFGNPIPVTFAAKTVVFDRVVQTSRLEHLREILGLLVPIPSDWAIAAAALAGLVFVVAKRRIALWPALAWYAAYWAAYAVSKLPAVGKYATPTLPVHLALASIGVTLLARWTLARWPRHVTYAMGGALMCASFLPLRFMERNARAHEKFEREVRTAAALWIKDHSAPTDRVMITYGSSVGTFGYYSERPILDSKGTVTPVTLPFWKTARVSPDYDIARALHPEWCILRSPELALIERGAADAGRSWGDDYQLATSFHIHRDESYEIYRRRK